MQRVASVLAPHKILLARAATPIVTCAIGASLLLAPVAQAQDAATPDASPVASPAAADQAPVDATSLISYDVEAFPTAPVSVRLLRMTLQPGASSPMHTHPGIEFDLVESGTLTVDSDGDADLSRGGDDPVTGPLAGENLGSGDLVVFPAGTGMLLSNTSEEPVVILSAVFHPVNADVSSTTYADGDPGPNAFEGVSYQVLGDGIAQTFPEGPATVSLEQLTVPAGTDMPPAEGASLYSLVSGNFAFAVQGGDVQVSRTASPGLKPNAAPEQEYTLAPGDAAFFPNGVTGSARADQDSDLALLRLTAEPSAAGSSDQASLTFIAPTAEAEEGEAGEETDQTFTEVAVGAPVVTTTGSVNVRVEPSIEAEVVEQVDEGVALTVIGGPEDVGDFTWWQVSIDDSGAEGWVAADFIGLANAPEATEEPAATEEPEVATPDASPEASPVASDFAEGDIVVTNSDNVRIRAEATVDGEPVDAFPIGTELEITGAPEEADDYTWYPVTLVADDSISGWIAADFIEPAPDDDEEG